MIVVDGVELKKKQRQHHQLNFQQRAEVGDGGGGVVNGDGKKN